MRLVEHEAFADLVIAASVATGIPEPLVEKDYWITEILRVGVDDLGPALLFKGGTSLSKGWNLIHRFSEDLDLLIDPRAVNPAWETASQVDDGLRSLAARIGAIDGLSKEPRPVHVLRGSSRADRFHYEPRFEEIPGLGAAVLVEPGIGGGYAPRTTLSISSLVADRANELDVSFPGVEDLASFPVEVIERRRTFVEKLFTVESAVRGHQAGAPISREVRHYADLFVLVDLDDVRLMLSSDEYGEIVADVDAQGKRFYPKRHQCPPGMRFRDSVLFPPSEIIDEIRAKYDQECSRLFFGGAYPTFGDVLTRLGKVRDML